jgi:hypothetical protein
MTDELETTSVEPQADAPAEASQDAGLAAFAALEAQRGLGLNDDDEYAAKDSADALAEGESASDAGEQDDEADSPSNEPVVARSEEREAAVRALRRAKTPQSVMDGLSDEDLIAWGAQLAKIQADVDNKLSAKTDSESEEDGDDTVEAADTPAPAQADATADIDWDALTAPLKDTFGDDDAEAVIAPMRTMFQRVSQQNQMLSNAVEGLLIKESFRQLSDAYPQLADSEQLEAVKAKARSLNWGEYQSMDDLLRDAARLEFGSPRDAAKEKRSSVSRKRSASQTRTAARKVAVQPDSDFDSGFEMFKRLEQEHGLS